MFRKVGVMCMMMLTLNAQQTPEDILAKLTMRQKIGQLFVVAAASNFNQPTESLSSSMAKCPYDMDPKHVENLIKEHNVGGVIFLYKSDPETQMNLAKKFQAAATIPLLMTQDSEWGLSMRLDNDPTKVVRFPRNMTLGAIQDEQIVYDVAHEIGKECSAIGVHANWAPVADTNNNRENPVIHDRAFGDNPERVSCLGQLFVRGLQDAGVLACAKHFPGHGDTDVDSHIDLPVIKHNRARLDAVELVPFKALIKQGVDSIMSAHLQIPILDDSGTPSSLSHKIITQLLQNELGYQGLKVTDGLGMDAVMKKYEPGYLELAAFLAGNDILLCPLDVPRAIALIEASIKAGQVSEEDLNNRVLKILRAKAWAFKQQKVAHSAIEDVGAYLVREEAYELQQRAYRAAITLVPQHEKISLHTDTVAKSCIVQIGKLPDNTFAQTCEQYAGRVNFYSCTLTEKDVDACITQAQQHDTVVIAVGEMNKFINKNFGVADRTCLLVQQLSKMSKKVVIVLFGSPYSIPLFQEADLIIEAYEDAPAAQKAVVDTLRGELKPSGVLPVQI